MSNCELTLDGNVRSRGYFVLRTRGRCPRCGALTRLVALALPHEHEILADEPDERGEQPVRELWQAALCSALLFYVGYLPRAAQRRMAEFSPHYRHAPSAATQESYWANHCEHCGSTLEDHDLYCEPDGAFLPLGGAAAADVELIWIGEPIEAQVGGYSCDPDFLASATGA
jgi:hypothetical protein